VVEFVAGLIDFSVTPKHQDWFWGYQTSCPVGTEGLVHFGYNNWYVKLIFCLLTYPGTISALFLLT